MRFYNFPLVLPVKNATCYSHLSAWCAGGLVPFVINVTHLRMKRPLHNRCTRTDTFVRWVVAVARAQNRCKFVTVSLLKRFHNGRLTSETATWIQKWCKTPARTSKALDTTIFRGGGDGRGHRSTCKTPRGSSSNQGGWHTHVHERV